MKVRIGACRRGVCGIYDTIMSAVMASGASPTRHEDGERDRDRTSCDRRHTNCKHFHAHCGAGHLCDFRLVAISQDAEPETSEDVMQTRRKVSADELVLKITVGLVSLVFASPFVRILIAYGYGFESLP